TSRRTLKLTTFPAFAQGWLVRRIDAFLRRHDDIELELDATPHLVNLKTGAADVAIRYGKGDWEGLESTLLMPEYVEAVCSPDFRRRHGGLREPKDLAEVPLLRHTVLKWTPWFRSGGLDWPEPARGPKYNDGSVMLEAAADGQGVALARSVMLEPYLASGRIESPFNVKVLSDFAYYLVYPRAVRSRSEVVAFIDWITTEAKQDTAQAPKAG
ncbi:MAG TPA: LysR substrate-binding domain-containing protein, partial [Pelomicrobium sp.]|nr:LysR substrate-binding domain-containing protein [Pelomicrobium sp.]